MINLQGNKTIYPQSIEFKQPFLLRSYFLIDGKDKVDPINVNYYEVPDGFYIRNTFNIFRRDEFLERKFQGRITKYSKYTETYNRIPKNWLYKGQRLHFKKGKNQKS